MSKSKQQPVPKVQRVWVSLFGLRSTRIFTGDNAVSDAISFAEKANRSGFSADVGWKEVTGGFKGKSFGRRFYSPSQCMRNAEPLQGMSKLVEIGLGELDFYLHRLLTVRPPGALNRVYDCYHFQYTPKGISRAKRLIAEWQGELPK